MPIIITKKNCFLHVQNLVEVIQQKSQRVIDKLTWKRSTAISDVVRNIRVMQAPHNFEKID